ncbi:hypothetical protein [Streptomyces sp. NPDC001787]|uniref:hypothetical protein n=1 Tax=Streptomyces sp. NPDC001787 TaxID=3154523 RepID=UPI0033241989
MTILIDTKNEIKTAVSGLTDGVGEVDRELRAAAGAITELRETDLANLKSSQHETRTSAYNAGKRASEAVTAVVDLRRDVERLHHGLADLRRDMDEVLSLLRAGVPVAAGGPAVMHQALAVADTPGPDAVPLPGQRQVPQEESMPATADSPSAAVPPAEPAAENAPPAPEPETEQPTQEAGPGDGSETRQEETEDQEETDQDSPRAALEASTRNSDEPGKEPYPLSAAGRIWAIMRAGRVASATLVCHRDTWEFVAAQVGNHPHFRTPALEERDNGLVAAVLSGRSLVAMLLSLYRVAETQRKTEAHQDAEGTDELVAAADWAMASQVYYETARVLNRALSQDGDPVVVTIDNRLLAHP